MVGEFTSGLFSPFIVPVAGTFMVFGIVAVSKWSEYNTRRLQFEERMAAIAKGIPLPEPALMQREQKSMSLDQRNRNIRLAGIICVAGSLALALFFFVLAYIVDQRGVLAGAAAAIVPFGIGAGLLIDARINSRALAEDHIGR